MKTSELTGAHFEGGGRITYAQLKQGQPFQFIQDGAVYIRCRGGYRPGRGGPLVKFNYPACPVYPY